MDSAPHFNIKRILRAVSAFDATDQTAKYNHSLCTITIAAFSTTTQSKSLSLKAMYAVCNSTFWFNQSSSTDKRLGVGNKFMFPCLHL